MDLQQATFGVEIECFIPYEAMEREGWRVGGYHRGEAIPGHRGWKATSDGSIHADAGCSPVEVVSPVLRGSDGLAQLAAMAVKLNAMGAKVNRSCGFHVHVGFDAANEAAALVRMIFITANVEDGLFAATGSPSRTNNGFCKSVKTDFRPVSVGAVPRNLRGVQAKCPFVNDRYHVLNLQNLLTGRQPTVEFRVFAGTTNGTKMRAYVQLALGIVQLALEVPRRANWEAAPRRYAFTGGPGESSVRRMLCMLGWTRNMAVSYGKRPKAYGVMDGDAVLAEMKRLLVQLGRKFDGGPRRASDVVVDEQ